MTQECSQIASKDRPANDGQFHDTQRPVGDRVAATLRTSVGEFAFQPAPSGCHLEIIVGHVRRILGCYATSEEAFRALINRRTGFRAWDAVRGKRAVTQVNALKRWERSKQTN